MLLLTQFQTLNLPLNLKHAYIIRAINKKKGLFECVYESLYCSTHSITHSPPACVLKTVISAMHLRECRTLNTIYYHR